MKFIVDECVGLSVANWLRSQNVDVISVVELMPGATDNEVLQKACDDGRILITNDKDFGEMIFRLQAAHYGVILLRLMYERPENKIKVLQHVLSCYSDKLEGNFIVATEATIKVVELKATEYH
jgi:predicted nuclease of predicted toxin-antitoxin system